MSNWTFGSTSSKIVTQSTPTKSSVFTPPVKTPASTPSPVIPTPSSIIKALSSSGYIKTNTPTLSDYASVSSYTPIGKSAPVDLMNIGLKSPTTVTPTSTSYGGNSGGGGVGWGYLANGQWGKIGTANLSKERDTFILPSWSETYKVDNAPTWWKGMTYSGDDANTKYAMMLNALIPSLSPEDGKTMASYLYQTFNATMPEAFGAYNPEVAQYGAVPKLSPELQTQFTSKNRATSALTSLDKLLAGSGKSATDFGEGYTYLRRLLSTMGSFGGESETNKQTREQVVQQLGALEPVLAEAKGTLSPYASIAQALTTPYFSSGSVVPISKSTNGEYIFGNANKRLY